jgi:hypothetical protein
VEIIIPVPRDADTPKFKASIGNVKYTPEETAFVWYIKSFPGKFFEIIHRKLRISAGAEG